ncbi:RbsD/FucU domain-containing protein [Crenobacter oryzisoli]
MKKYGTLNAQLSRVLAELGHGDSVVIPTAVCRSRTASSASIWR